MHKLPFFTLLVPLLGAGAVATFAACSDSTNDTGSSSGTSGASGTSGTSGASGTSGGTSGSSGGEEDAAAEDAATDTGADACTSALPSLDAGGLCGTMEFGTIAAPFGPVDASSNTYAGGTFPAGIYDAVVAERASASAGSWRETFVSDGAGRFTRIRQIDTGGSGGAGPVTRRSGTYTATGDQVTFTYDCAYSGENAVDGGRDIFPFEVVGAGACGATYRYGASSIRISLTRR